MCCLLFALPVCSPLHSSFGLCLAGSELAGSTFSRAPQRSGLGWGVCVLGAPSQHTACQCGACLCLWGFIAMGVTLSCVGVSMCDAATLVLRHARFTRWPGRRSCWCSCLPHYVMWQNTLEPGPGLSAWRHYPCMWCDPHPSNHCCDSSVVSVQMRLAKVHKTSTLNDCSSANTGPDGLPHGASDIVMIM